MSKFYKQSLRDPKNVTYQKDGTGFEIGRDTYISFNNGGVYKYQYQFNGTLDPGKLPYKRQYIANTIPISGKMTHYNTNGSGRDIYIGCDSGGLQYMDQKYTLQGKSTFIGSLRTYQRIPQSLKRRENRFFTEQPTLDLCVGLSANRSCYINEFTQGKQIQRKYKSRVQSMEQRNSVERLALPKDTTDPYENLRTYTSSFYRRRNTAVK